MLVLIAAVAVAAAAAPALVIGGFTIDTSIDITTLLAMGGGIAAFLKMWKAQSLRDQKIDIVLFGTEGSPGLIKHMEHMGERIDQHHSWLSDIRYSLGYDRRGPIPDRREPSDNSA